MSFDYRKLRGKIREFGTQAEVAEKIGISPTSFSKKINEESDFSNSEIVAICEILSIPANEIPNYFFTELVKQP